MLPNTLGDRDENVFTVLKRREPQIYPITSDTVVTFAVCYSVTMCQVLVLW